MERRLGDLTIEVTRHIRRYGGRTVVARKAERRQRFLDAATQLFAERGYLCCSVADVCAAAGLSKRQFYEEFQTREDVLVAAYDRIHDDATAAVATALAVSAASVDPRLPVRTGSAAYLASIGSDPYRARIAFVEVVGLSKNMEYRRLLRKYGWAEQIENALSAVGARLRGHDSGVGVALLAGAVDGIAHELMLRELEPTRWDIAELLDELAVAFVETGPI
ncbi:TetR/AcrR family transcriptional regulator [Nocardia asteroides]|uniref:TetR/AcrR family transcriptional regulator n=1 Tax=Nocardia asteroides TaxID=1824 RepID=UPI0037C7FB4C